MSVYMYLKINALGDYKKKYDPFARLLVLKRGVGVCSVVGVVSVLAKTAQMAIGSATAQPVIQDSLGRISLQPAEVGTKF